MSNYESEIKRRRTFAIISHPDAGKTTLTEKFLLYGCLLYTSTAGEYAGRYPIFQHSLEAVLKITEKRREIAAWRAYPLHSADDSDTDPPPDRDVYKRQEKLIEAIIETFITETDDIQSELCGYVFKVEYTDRKKRLTYLRLYHGTLHLRDELPLSKKDVYKRQSKNIYKTKRFRAGNKSYG